MKIRFIRTVFDKSKKYLVIFSGCLLYAFGVGIFLDPANIISGGITGISMILSRIFPVNTGIFILAINIPIILTGRVVFGRKFFFLTLLGTFLSSLFVFITETLLISFLPITEDKFVSAIAGQGLIAVGLALVFCQGATTGGTDVAAKLILKKYPHITMGKIIMVFDFAVIIASVIVFKNFENGVYSFIAVTVGNVVLDKVLYGFEEARIIIVISDKWQNISENMLKKADVGVTVFQGIGAYTGKEKRILFITVKKNFLPKIKKAVKEIDADSFMIVSSANEVLGNGFKTK